jgi:hypothetical protein
VLRAKRATKNVVFTLSASKSACALCNPTRDMADIGQNHISMRGQIGPFGHAS